MFQKPFLPNDPPVPLTVGPGGFCRDGKPFRLFGGAMHYFRIPAEYWRDRLLKLKALGCNTVETYVAWNAHEPRKGEFRFDGMLDIERFIDIAQELGLYVIVRPGPYICAEWDLGGLPWWLLAEDAISLRCSDPRYLSHVDDFFAQLLPRLVSKQATHAGPIIAMQIENEYGYYGNDSAYLEHLRDEMVRLGVDVPLFTSDGAYQKIPIINGGVDGHLRTANFGSGASARFKVLREAQKDGPLVCMEFWVGWFDTWGDEKHQQRPAADVAKELDAVLSVEEASANIYMFHGGTNFGFTAGGNLSDGTFKPFVTSYDYDALLTEWGDITPKYEACRAVVHRHAKLALKPHGIAPVVRKSFGKVELRDSTPLVAALPWLSEHSRYASPRSLEQLGAQSRRSTGNGFVLYRTRLPALYRGEQLAIAGMHDWCNVLVNGRSIATWYRNDPAPTMKLEFHGEAAQLEILVAHLARSNFGHRMAERKGITGGVYVGLKEHDQRALFGWEHFLLSFDDAAGFARVPFVAHATDGPRLLRGSFSVDRPADTFLHLEGFTLGCAFINGFNLGRYWNAGPQRALYVPGPMLRAGVNELVIFEAANATADSAHLCSEPGLTHATLDAAEAEEVAPTEHHAVGVL
jgi:beta-galactosidase